MTDKPKRQNKKKEQIAWEIKQKSEATRKRAFVTDTFFPLLQKYTHSIHQAKQVCKILQNDIMSTFNQGMKEPVSSLKLTEKVEGLNDEGSESYRALIDAFKDMTISEAMELIGGMPDAITGGMGVEERDRPLSELEFVDGTMRIKAKSTLQQQCAEAYCNEFRQLAEGAWVAYSKKLNEAGDAYYRAQGATIEEAVSNLKLQLHAPTN